MRRLVVLLVAALHGCGTAGSSVMNAPDVDRIVAECDAMSDLFKRFPKIDRDKFMESALSNDPDWRLLTMQFLSNEGKRIGLEGTNLAIFRIRVVSAFYQEAVLVSKELNQDMPPVEIDAIRKFLAKEDLSKQTEEDILSSLFTWYGKGPERSRCRLHR